MPQDMRQLDGKTVKIMGTDVVPTDLIAAVAGVNFNSVVKVIAAIDLITFIGRVKHADLLEFSATPKRPGRGRGQTVREDATQKAALDIAKACDTKQFRELLSLDSRLGQSCQDGQRTETP